LYKINNIKLIIHFSYSNFRIQYKIYLKIYIKINIVHKVNTWINWYDNSIFSLKIQLFWNKWDDNARKHYDDEKHAMINDLNLKQLYNWFTNKQTIFLTIKATSNATLIAIWEHPQHLLKCLLTVTGSSPLFLLAGSSDIFGTGALWPLIHAVALFWATGPVVSG